MTCICIITARGGSKRIPRKNIKEFCGKPIIAYSIEVALQSKNFTEVMVSTDDAEIATVAKKYGAKVPFMRSKKNSDDYATTADVLAEVIDEYKNVGKTFEDMCCIYPTAPFVTSEKLKNAYNLMKTKKANAIIPVVKFSYPPQRSFVIDKDCLEYKWPENVRKRSQDLQPYYHDAGQFYFWQLSSFKEGNLSNTVPYILDEMEVQDIDNLQDWQLAEIKYKMMVNR